MLCRCGIEQQQVEMEFLHMIAIYCRVSCFRITRVLDRTSFQFDHHHRMEFCTGDTATSLSTSPASAQHGTITHPSTLHFTASPAHQWIESHLRANYDDVYLRKCVADVSLPLWLTWNEISMETQFRGSSCWGWWRWHPIRDAHVWWINGKWMPMSIDPSGAEAAASITQLFLIDGLTGLSHVSTVCVPALYLEEGSLWRHALRLGRMAIAVGWARTKKHKVHCVSMALQLKGLAAVIQDAIQLAPLSITVVDIDGCTEGRRKDGQELQ